MEKYRVVRRIGQGAFGRIFLVQNTEASSGDEYEGVCSDEGKNLFVLKETTLSTTDAKARARAVNEAKFMKQMHHPNIVAVYEYFIDEQMNTLSIIMEYVDGGDLAMKMTELKGHSPPSYFSENTILDYVGQICSGLQYIHSRKILHRDIKASNIFLTQRGDLKLGDFGIAYQQEMTADNANTQIGTPFSLSPEICKGKPYNQKSDMWALGVVAYELMCFQRPFTGPNLAVLVTKIVNSPPEPLDSSWDISLRKLVMNLLCKNPAKRPSINDVLQAPPFCEAKRRPPTKKKSGKKKPKSKETLKSASSKRNLYQRRDKLKPSVPKQAKSGKRSRKGKKKGKSAPDSPKSSSSKRSSSQRKRASLPSLPLVVVSDEPVEPPSPQHGHNEPESAEEKQYVRCAECKQSCVVGECLELDVGETDEVDGTINYYHEQCFRCTVCGCDLSSNGCVFKDGIRYCINCEEKTANSNRWPCVRCTYINHPSFRACEVCRTERSWFQQVPQPSRTGQAPLSSPSNAQSLPVWSCPLCTFENTTPRCDICGYTHM